MIELRELLDIIPYNQIVRIESNYNNEMLFTARSLDCFKSKQFEQLAKLQVTKIYYDSKACTVTVKNKPEHNMHYNY